MVNPNQVIHGLPPLKWRGLTHRYYTDASWTFALTQAEQRYPYINDASHEFVALEPQRLPLDLHFLNSLYEDAFPGNYNDWIRKLIDGKGGTLEHPLRGEVYAVVMGGDIRLTATATAGVVAQITWSTSIEDPEKGQTIAFVKADLAAAAIKCQAAIDNAEIPFPSQAGVLDLLDLAALIESAIIAAELEALGVINLAKKIISDIIGTAELLQDHGAHDVLDTASALWGIVDDLGDTLGANAARETGIVFLANPTTLDAFARNRGMTLPEAISLNPGALISPSVPAGTGLKYYK